MFAGSRAPWWIAGGWAIDLFVGRQTREHKDTDAQVLRRDLCAVRDALQGWDVQAADPARRDYDWPFRAWLPGEPLDSAMHDVWLRPGAAEPWALQLMVADVDGADWLFRRDPRVRRPLTTIGRCTGDGIPYLAPEIQLLYKATAPRAKDEADLTIALPFMDRASRRWLEQDISMVNPGHPWLAALDSSCQL